MKPVIAMAAVAVVILSAQRAQAAAEFDLAIGYSHLWLDGSDRFEERDGVRVEPRFTFGGDGLRLGFGVGISGYSHELEEDTIIIIDDGDDIDVFEADQWESVSLLVPEFQVSFRQPLGDQWFIEPGVGVGAVFANYYIADEFWWSDDEESEWDTTFGVRPFVRAGWRGERWVFAAEASYLFGGDVELTDQVHGDVSELFIGGFFGFQF